MTGGRGSRRANAQGGFTLLELLVAMVLVLVLIIGIERFTAGVVLDQEVIGKQQEEATETRIVLSNLARDVARANFYPYASLGASLPTSDLSKATNGDNLFGVRYAAPTGTADCNGASVQKNEFAKGWIVIENRYVLTSEGSLSCDGSGGNNGQVRLIDNVAKLSGVAAVRATAKTDTGEVDLVANPQFIPANTKLVQLCLLTRVAQSTKDAMAATTDCAGNALPSESLRNWVYYKTQLDVAVGSHGFLAGDNKP